MQVAVCAFARVWPLPGGLLPSQQEYSFSGFIPTNKQTNKEGTAHEKIALLQARSPTSCSRKSRMNRAAAIAATVLCDNDHFAVEVFKNVVYHALGWIFYLIDVAFITS